MTYGDGSGQNTGHYYDGTINNAKKSRKMAHKKKKCAKKRSKQL